MKRHMQTHNRDGHTASVPTPSAANAGNSQSSQSSSQGADIHTSHSQLPDLDPVAAEITIQDGAVSVMAEESLTSQPMNLNMTVPASERGEGTSQEGSHTPQQISEQQLSAEEVTEEVMQYSRDPLETVRDGGGNTLYVWPIYMA